MDQPALKVLFVSSEVAPLAKTGGLADVAGALPPALAQLGVDVRMAMPLYAGIDPVNGAFRASTRWIELPFGRDLLKVALYQGTLPGTNIPIQFVSYDPYFRRPGLYGDSGKDYVDNLERFSLFCHVILRRIRPDGWVPDIIHCNDWQTGLIPALVAVRRAGNPLMRKVKTLFTIHNIGYQGLYGADRLAMTGLEPWQYSMEGVEFYGQISLLKAGILYSDWVTTVSPTYATEIQTPEYGGGMDGLLRHVSGKLTGVLNGVDYAAWDPRRDPVIAQNYHEGDLSGKAACKRGLQLELELPPVPDAPLLAMVTRLVEQKGLDLVEAVVEDFVGLGAQLVVLGLGDDAHKDYLVSLRERYPDRVAVVFAFNDELAHKIEAGADIFLMPSRYEPCGLNQIYSLRYGTVPVVRRTGGLADTVVDYSERTGEGTGFVFNPYTADAFKTAVLRAMVLYCSDGERWKGLQRAGMRQDFSWSRSASRYLELYRRIAGSGARVV